MTKVWIHGTEWYPVFQPIDKKKHVENHYEYMGPFKDLILHDVSDKTLKRWKDAEKTFNACQREMEKLL